MDHLSENSFDKFEMNSKIIREQESELNQTQLFLLDKLNLQNIIENKNLSHAITA